jgi:hypothetical protein
MMQEFIQTWSRSDRKHYHQLAEVEVYAWVEGYLQAKIIRSKIAELKTKKREFKKAPSAIKSLRKRVEIAYPEYRQRRKTRIRKYLERQINSPNPLARLERLTDSYLENLILFDEFDEVLTEMESQDENAILDEDREKGLASVERRLKKLRGDLIKNLENYGSGYLQVENAELIEDIRDTFVNNWRSLQGWCSEPVNPLGFHIRFSPKAEQEAFEKLDIISAKQPNAKKLAAVKEQ